MRDQTPPVNLSHADPADKINSVHCTHDEFWASCKLPPATVYISLAGDVGGRGPREAENGDCIIVHHGYLSDEPEYRPEVYWVGELAQVAYLAYALSEQVIYGSSGAKATAEKLRWALRRSWLDTDDALAEDSGKIRPPFDYKAWSERDDWRPA